MDIKEIAEQVSKRIYVEDGLLLSKFISEKFAEALIESYKAELLNKVGEPVACVDARDWEWHANNSPETTLGVWTTSDWKRKLNLPNQVPMFFYTSDQVAAAILKGSEVK